MSMSLTSKILARIKAQAVPGMEKQDPEMAPDTHEVYAPGFGIFGKKSLKREMLRYIDQLREAVYTDQWRNAYRLTAIVDSMATGMRDYMSGKTSPQINSPEDTGVRAAQAGMDFDKFSHSRLNDQQDAEPRDFVYIIDLDEHGVFKAHVEDDKGQIVWSCNSEDDESYPFEDGFMKHSKDLQGLRYHLLKDLGVMKAQDELWDHEIGRRSDGQTTSKYRTNPIDQSGLGLRGGGTAQNSQADESLGNGKYAKIKEPLKSDRGSDPERMEKTAKDKANNNPWAICHSSTDKDGKETDKFEKCVKDVKKKV